MEIKNSVLEKLRGNLFVNPTENLKAVLGSSYLQEVITSGKIKRGVFIVTNKRVYFRGKSITAGIGKLKSSYEEKTVDLQDITGSGYKILTSPGTLLFGIVAGASLMFIGPATRWYGDSIMPIAMLSVGAIVKYFLGKKNVFGIEYGGGSIYLKSSWYDEATIQDFERQVRRAKDALSGVTEEAGNIIIVEDDYEEVIEESPFSYTEPTDTVTKLSQAQVMLEKGLIDDEEFAELKREILHNSAGAR